MWRGVPCLAGDRLAHEKSVDAALGKLFDDLAPYAAGLPYDSDEASLIRVARRDFEKAIKVPADYVTRASALGSAKWNSRKIRDGERAARP